MREPQIKEFYDFGSFRLEVKKHRLWRGEELVALTPKEFELLLILVENSGRVMEKDELHEMIWKDTFVEDGTLTRNISWLRQKLGAGNVTGQKFIETCPKRGYRFLPEVTKSSGEGMLVVDEQTLTRIRIEETISLTDNSMGSTAERRLGEVENKTRGFRKVAAPYWFVLGIAAIAVIGFTAYQMFFAEREAKFVLLSRVAPFSGLPGRESSPAFSPDNKQIAFVWNGGGDEIPNVYIKLIGAGEPVRLTRGESAALAPIFSPDGRQIAFTRAFIDKSEIYLISALGGAERKIVEVQSGGSSFSFSTDGKTIAVADKDGTSSTRGIFFVRIETGEKQRLTAPSENLSDNEPHFSPDGKSIAFFRVNANDKDDRDLYIVSAVGGESPRRLTFDKAPITGFAWSADSKYIFFSSRRGQVPSSNLWQIPAAGGEPILMMTGGKNPIYPAVSPDGKTIAYSEEFEDINIWQLNNSKSSAAPGGSEFKKFIASARSEHSQQIAPDGSQIVFVSDRTGSFQIWRAKADGSNLLQLTTSGGGSPRFSPDGKNIAYDLNIGGKGEIFVIGAEGGAPRRLTNNPAHDTMPAWSADGRWIYFTSDRTGDFQIWKMSADGGEARQITRNGALEAFESWDGKALFYSKARGVAGLWTTGTEGGEEAPVAGLAEAVYWRSWSVTPTGIYYVARSSSPPFQIKFYHFADGQTKEIAATEKVPLWDYSGLSASFDGKMILYAQQDQNTSSIILAEIGK